MSTQILPHLQHRGSNGSGSGSGNPAHGTSTSTSTSTGSSIHHHGPMSPSSVTLPSASSSVHSPTPPDTSATSARPLAGKKRKKSESNEEGRLDQQQQPPRRLRRLHEACARCRSKKIKCDSKHPSCTSCEVANAECNQEDRHRQKLQPRGHTERLEAQMEKCVQLLGRLIDSFQIDELDLYLMADFGLPKRVYPSSLGRGHSHAGGSSGGNGNGSASNINGIPTPGPSSPPIVRNPQPQFISPTYPPQFAPSSRFPDHTSTDVKLPFSSRPQSTAPSPRHELDDTKPTYAHAPLLVGGGDAYKGTDPQSNNLGTPGGLMKAFGVSKSITRGLKLEPAEREDEVGSYGYRFPRKNSTAHWLDKPISRRISGGPNPVETRKFYLPADRRAADFMVDRYFDRLNYHRPVFVREEFKEMLNALYDSVHGIPSEKYPIIQEDPGFLCSLYLILALGTLSEDNYRMHNIEGVSPTQSPGWPSHDEFFELSLAVKPDLRVTISSLQALILLQWYLYTERHGRTLWRLVGNLVRLAIELGLHHDPSEQNLFSPEECQLRMNLWWIVMIHDRGTSVLLGRPLAIADTDFNTPTALRDNHSKFSEHFDHSPPLTRIQGDIINALHRPGKQSVDQIVRMATRIENLFWNFKLSLPKEYQPLFKGTARWPQAQRVELVTSITEDQGLTMLKYGIARILLLRALFNSKELSAGLRYRALQDAVIMSHNVLIVHAQLTTFPDIAFFVSPIPIHIAAMVILYSVISRCEVLPYATAKEDVCIALKLVPLFRWRWSRKDCHGSHPLIVRLAQRVFDQDLMEGFGPTRPPMLMEEQIWSDCDARLLSTTSSHPQPSNPAIHSLNSMGGGSSGGKPSLNPSPRTPTAFLRQSMTDTYGRPLHPSGHPAPQKLSPTMASATTQELLRDPPPPGIFYPTPLGGPIGPGMADLRRASMASMGGHGHGHVGGPHGHHHAGGVDGADPYGPHHGVPSPSTEHPTDIAKLLAELGSHQAPGNIDYGQAQHYFVSEEFDREAYYEDLLPIESSESSLMGLWSPFPPGGPS
ncbi:hypothetical protein BOTBODRAFT_349070 [Botryobasidium botryosum FD-172 SS1]|uniref:Zn(2)-C6 fungal-type domain-containing protein n=1 Tax=Botryobasidium botryosum (strain FD-172 SS1) TaxID=930990 RepID=A0A067MFR2_BOTB1|nr:hypothetical protein BOTBODRAFT_349070 [Botryobasidium botryosum FD-172 SS1]